MENFRFCHYRRDCLYRACDHENAGYHAGGCDHWCDQYHSVFGPFIGAIPSFIIIVLQNPVQGLYFLIFVIILQQVDGNIIGPKILGDSTGLSSFWVVFAILVFGGLWGFPGMLLGVPIMAVIYYIVSNVVTYSLKNVGSRERR